MSHKQFCVAVLICAVLFIGFALAQNNTKPLTNDDVVAMVKGGLPENTVINAINAQDSNFDVSATALIKLKQQGINSKIMDAMLAAANKKHSAATAAAPAAAAAAPPPAAGQPLVMTLKGTTLQPIPVCKTQIAQTKTKAASLNALSVDNALGQAMETVAVSAA